MRFTDAHREALLRDGFAVLPGFLSPGEAAAALEGFHRFYAPDYEGWLAGGKRNPIEKPQVLFPWDHSGLNHAIAHPELIAISERLAGTPDLLLCEGHLGVKYAGSAYWEAVHVDYSNNTLGPECADPEEMLRRPVFFYYFTDVAEDTAPIRMVPYGAPDEASVPVCGPAGTLCIYTLNARHTASPFLRQTGYRAVAWVMMYDRGNPFDFPRVFTNKSGVPNLPEGQYERGLARFIREASPRQLGLLGFHPPGHPWWTEDRIRGMEKRYPGFRGDPYRG